MHSSLVVTQEGLPLGLGPVKFASRDKFKGTAQLKRKINLTRVLIEAKESVRWLDNFRQSVPCWGDPTGVFTSVIEKATFTSAIALPRILAPTSLSALLSIGRQAAATVP